MLNFRPDSNRDQGFTLDKRAQYRRRAMAPKEWRVLVMMPFILGAVVWLWYDFMELSRQMATPPREVISREAPLEPMPEVVLPGADALPSAAGIAEETEAMRALVDESDVSLVVGGLDARTLAWTGARLAADRLAPPVPQRVYPRDLIQGEVRAGSPVLVAGRVIDHAEAPVDGGEPWQRVLLLADGDPERQQFIQLVLDQPRQDLVIGAMVNAVGRSLGQAPLPSASGAYQVPLVAARSVITPNVEEAQDPLTDFRRVPPERLPEDWSAGISDERGLVETRSFYHLIGQAWADRERAQPEALPNLNNDFHKLHADPDAWRGRRCEVEITVYEQWEDHEATRDRPFGAGRSTRILGYTRDIGPWVETSPEGTQIRSIKSVLRLVEFVLVGDGPRPRVHDRIRADGRFLKYRAIQVRQDSLRDQVNRVQRQSDKAYTVVMVGSAWRTVPPRPPLTMRDYLWYAAIVSVVVIAAIALVMIVRSDHRKHQDFQLKIRRLREQRRALDGRRSEAASEPPPTPQEPAP